MRTIYLIPIILLAFGQIKSQTISRSVLCSIGTTQTNGNGQSLLSTFGQCPGCTTMTNADGSVLTQGFQQPSKVIDADCQGLAEFEVDDMTGACGSTFSFFYVGWGDTDNASFSWSFGANAFPQTSSDPNPDGVSFSTIGVQNISLEVSFEDCEVLESQEVTSTDEGFGVNANLTTVSCQGESDGTAQLEIINGSAPYTINWSNGETTEMLINLDVGDYGYTVVDANGCEANNTISITEPANPLTIDFNTTKVSCGDAMDGTILTNISGGTSPYSYQWSNNELSNNLENLSIGNYSLTVVDANGCSTTAEAVVSEACRPTIYNTVSPNGDGMNDIWLIEDIADFPNNEVKIYNRWGSLIYEMTGYNNDWVGTDENGKPLLAGAYYYVLHLNNADNIVLTGSVTIVR